MLARCSPINFAQPRPGTGGDRSDVGWSWPRGSRSGSSARMPSRTPWLTTAAWSGARGANRANIPGRRPCASGRGRQDRHSGVHDLDGLHPVFGGYGVHEALAKRLADLPQTEAFTIDDAAGQLVNGSRQWPVATLLPVLPGVFPLLRGNAGSQALHFRSSYQSFLWSQDPCFSRAGSPHQMERFWVSLSRRSCLTTSKRFSPETGLQ